MQRQRGSMLKFLIVSICLCVFPFEGFGQRNLTEDDVQTTDFKPGNFGFNAVDIRQGRFLYGDSVAYRNKILLSGFMLSPLYGFLAAGVGSALADLFSGYVVYAPATFIIKGVMALIAYYGFKIMCNKLGNTPSKIVSGAISEIIMVLGYFVFEGFMYGFIPSAVNIPANAVQGVAGLILGVTLVRVFEKHKITL